MIEIKDIARYYKELLRMEEQAQTEKYENGNLSTLRKEGYVLDQYKILRKRFGFGDYPILKIAFNKHQSIQNFREGVPVQLKNLESEENVNGRVLYMNNGEGEIALFCDDFDDWMESNSCILKILPDNKSFSQMQGALKLLENESDSNLVGFLNFIYNTEVRDELDTIGLSSELKNKNLNSSQKEAVKKLQRDERVLLIHGPPGTGKTTTLVEAVCQWVESDKSVLISAPANAAVDHFAAQLLMWKIPFIRLGNVHKAKQDLWDFTIEGILNQPNHAKALKKLKVRAEEFRKMASQYKRNFGKEEREQRKLIRREYQALKKEIRKETDYILAKEMSKVNVVLGTPVALQSELINDREFDYVIIDEAGQCLLPMALLAARKASQVVLAGDPFQLPPTVISEKAAKEGLNKSILEIAFEQSLKSEFLAIQYRMPPKIAAFSSRFFYEGKLKSYKEESSDDSIVFIDTAGANYLENKDENNSKFNEQELLFLVDYIKSHLSDKQEIVFISPYSAQVSLAKELLPENVHCATIDSFQGQEAQIIIISLVRSNEQGEIGFLKEYRRMNVAMTRAKEKLIVLGDSATLGNDTFYNEFLTFAEENQAYKSVFEFASFDL